MFGELLFCCFKIKKRGHNVLIGIKNSWKYEKDYLHLNLHKAFSLLTECIIFLKILLDMFMIF